MKFAAKSKSVKPSIQLLNILLMLLCLLGAVRTAQADVLIVIEKKAINDTLQAGDPVVYRISYRVASITENADSLVITDVLPVQVSGASGDVSLLGTAHVATTSYNQTTRTATFRFISPLQAGSTGDLYVTTKFLAGSTPDGTTTVNIAKATAKNAPPAESAPAPVTATANFEMTALKDLSVVGSLDVPYTYRLRLRNPDGVGGLNFQNVVLVDSLPAGAVFVSASNGGLYDSGSHTVTWPAVASVSATAGTDALTRTVTVLFPSTDFTVGQSIRNFFMATGTPLGKTDPVTLTATYNHTISGASATMTFDKSANVSSQEIAKSVSYYFNMTNSGNVPLTLAEITDTVPAQDSVTAIVIREVSSSSPGRVYYQTTSNSSWTEVSGGPFSTTTTVSVSSLGLSSGDYITALRYTWPSVPFPFTGWSTKPGYNATILARDRSGNAVTVGQVIRNTAQLSYQYNSATTNITDSQNITVIAPPVVDTKARPRAEKSRVGSGNIIPSSQIVYNVKVRNQPQTGVAMDSLINPVATDLLDSRLDYVANSWTVFNKPAGAPDPQFSVITNYDNTGRTLLRWSWTGASAYKLPAGQEFNVRFTAQVKSGATSGNLDNYANIVAWDNTSISTAGAQGTTTDTNDMDGDGNRTETIVRSSQVRLVINVVASMEAVKLVKGELDSDWSRYPSSGQTVPGGVANYKITIRNTGNVAMKSIQLLDVLPHVGDTGVIDTQQRNTEWRPNLMGEVSIPIGTVYYSIVGNPIRPEYSSAGTQAPNWNDHVPSDITQVRSFKVDFGSLVLQPLQEVTIEWGMRAPNGTPYNKVAWNSFGYLAFRNDNNDQLLPAEPFKVGIEVKQGSGAIYGDRVWLDDNRNGIQDDNEHGLNGIMVILKTPGPDGQANTADDQEVARATTADDANGVPGLYSFPELASGDYFAQFLPTTYYTVTEADKGGDNAKDSDVNPATNTVPITHLDNSEQDLSWDMGVYRLSSAIGNLVWEDKNRDGLQNNSEPGINNVRVILRRGSDNSAVDSTLTASDGSYGFANLDPGSYYVQFRLPANYTYTQKDAGGNDQLDSDVDPGTQRTIATSIAGGEADFSWDAGMYKTPARIGNFIWHDKDADGLQDNDELGMAGVIVHLYYANGSPAGADTTDANGLYGFINLIPDTSYYVVVEKPAGFGASPVDQGGNNALDSDAAVANGTMAATSLDAGENDPDWDAGFYRPASLGNLVWRDDNQDGVQNNGEPGMENVRVILLNGSGQPVDSTFTDENGNYGFANLTPGNYRIQVDKPQGYDYTGQNQGGDDNLDSDLDGDNGQSPAITLVSGDNQLQWDGGLYPLYVSLGDLVWHDANQDGQQSSGEPGIAGVLVALYKENGDFVAADTTDANGYYLFDELVHGNYWVKFAQPDGYHFTTALSGATNTDSDANAATGKTGVITLLPAQDRRDIDAGLIELSSIGNLVWNDANADGVQNAGEPGLAGVVVGLYNKDGAWVASDTTDIQGNYGFEDLLPGEYSVTIVKPSGYESSPVDQGGADAVDSDAASSDGKMAQTTLTPGENDVTWDAGFYQYASLGNYIWRDENRNGLQDDGENGLANVQVILLNSSGAPLDTTYTDGGGLYQFSGLLPGTYSVQVTKPQGFDFTGLDQGSNDGLDSDVDPSLGKTAAFVLVSGDNQTQWDGGLTPIYANLGDRVWHDQNQDGQQSEGEPGIAGVRVVLNKENGDFVAADTTDANGYYLFVNLQPISYRIVFERPDNYVFTRALIGDSDTDSDAGSTTGVTAVVTVALGDARRDIDAGLIELSSIGNFVWLDQNADGVQNAGEPGLAGVVVGLYNKDGAWVASDTTDIQGNYGFEDLLPGEYSVTIVKPSGYESSPVDQGGADAVDSDAASSDGKMAQTTLTPGENDVTWDAGFYQYASLGNYIWRDENRNGLQDDGENGLANVQVILLNSSGAPLDTTYTDGDGLYQFSGLLPGTYSVQVTKPQGFDFTGLDQGSNDGLDSDVDPSLGKTAAFVLVSGDNQTQWDGGLTPIYANLGDRVWHDQNQDGQQSEGEPGIAGVRVVLNKENGDFVAADTTDADGYYLFVNLQPISYRIVFERPDNYVFTSALIGDSDTDSDADSTTGVTAVVTVALGDARRDIDAGLIELSSIGNLVWNDANADGVQNAGEPGLAGVVVHLHDKDGALVASDTTDSQGFYGFGGLMPTIYSISVEKPTHYAPSPLDMGGNDALDSDASVANGQMTSTLLAPGENDLTWDAGFYELSSLGNYVWEDADRDGIQDEGEKPIANLQVRLLDESKTLLRTTQTDQNGLYQFTDLNYGSYYVQFALTTEEAFTLVDVGGTDESDSDAQITDGMTTMITLAPGEHDNSWDAGLYGLVGLGNFVWYDLNRNGLQDSGEPGAAGVLVKLYNSDSQVIRTMTTDVNGVYYFRNLPPGFYFLEFVALENYNWTWQVSANPDRNSDPDRLTGRTKWIELLQGKDDESWDAGLVPVSSIGNYIWLDMNQDGVQDANEPGLKKVQVELYGSDEKLIATVETDDNGVYWFENLAAGDYIVKVKESTLPVGAVSTTHNSPMSVSLGSGIRFDQADFGYFMPTASIGDYVWYETDKDGMRQPGEKGLPDVKVQLFDAKGNLLRTTTTDRDGQYRFENLVTGEYTVRVVDATLPPLYFLTSHQRSITISVTEPRHYPDANFGYAETITPGCSRRVVAWYEPWYGGADRDSTSRHWEYHYRGGKADTSLFSLYDSREEKTWEYDILLAWASGIDGFVVDWFGKDSYENTGIHGLLKTADDLEKRFGAMGFDFQIMCAFDELASGRLDSNFIYLADSLMHHPSYWGHKNGERRPVFIYDWPVARYRYEDYRAAADTLLPADAYLLYNDRVDTTDYRPMDMVYPWVQTLPPLWDDLYGEEWGKPYLEGQYVKLADLPEVIKRSFSVGSVWPGFDDRPWQLGMDRWMARQDTLVYHWTWDMIRNNIHNMTLPWVLIESWNDFNRASQIEPSTDWDYKFIVQTRDQTYRHKYGNEECRPEYIENLGLLVPQHIRQARLAAEKYPALAAQINNLIALALQRFFERDFLSAISLADEAAGLSLEPVIVTGVTSHSVSLRWQPAERANGYVLYFSSHPEYFEPCSYFKPDSVLLNNVTTFTLTGLQSDSKIYLALCAIDSLLGPYANTSWFNNNRKGVQVLSAQTSQEKPGDPQDVDEADLQLSFVSGSPTFTDQDWDNAVDGDVDGWDGTVTMRGDASGSGTQQQMHQGPAWAVFKFRDDAAHQFNTVSLQTDNGLADRYIRNRWATKLDVLVSETDTEPTSFSLLLTMEPSDGNMTDYTLVNPVQAKYVKLVVYLPNTTSGAWRQITEFKVSTGSGLAKEAVVELQQPASFELYQNYPNPFNPTTTIRYELANDSPVVLKIYDIKGQEIDTLVDEQQNRGVHEAVWNAANHGSGIYFYRIQAGSFKKTQRMLLIK